MKGKNMLPVMVVSCVFPPEPVVSAKTSQSVAAGLAECGYDVTVLAPYPSRPGGKIYPSFKRKLYSRSRHSAGYRVVRCFSIPSAKSTAFSRFVENISFGISSAAYILFAPRPAAIYTNSWPVFASALLSLVARLRGIPYVEVIQDVYPESFYEQGRSNPKSLAVRAMRWLDQQIAKHAAHVIVLSETFARIYREDRKIPASRVSIIPNWAEKKAGSGALQIPSTGTAEGLRERFGIPNDAFLVAYGGNIGVAASVETLVEALNELNSGSQEEPVYGLIAGEGSSLVACRALAQGNRNISFFSPWPAEMTTPLYQSADVLVLPTQGSQSMNSVPSKLIHYMLSGRPVIAVGLPGSELVNVIEQSACGWWVAPDQPQLLAETIHHVQMLSPEELHSRGAAGRRFALDNFTSQTCLPKVIEVIEGAIQ